MGNFFDQLVKNDLRTYYNIRKVAIGHGDDDTTGCLLDLIIANIIIKC